MSTSYRPPIDGRFDKDKCSHNRVITSRSEICDRSTGKRAFCVAGVCPRVRGFGTNV